MKYIIISLIVFCGLCSCKRSDYNKLATINALIEANDLDSAETEIAKFRYAGIDNNNDAAYLNFAISVSAESRSFASIRALIVANLL